MEITADLAPTDDLPPVTGQAADPGEFVIQACQRARTWLRDALERGDTGKIAEIRSQAEAIRVYTIQKKLGTDAQFAAAEIVRRAETGLAGTIRQGQRTGEFRTRVHPGPGRGKPGNSDTRFPDVRSPSDYLGKGRTRTEIYAMADASDEEFEEALAEAKAAGNLSRANVVRILRQRRNRPPARGGQQEPGPADRSEEAVQVTLIRRWAADGAASGQIAGLLGMPDGAVRRLAREHGIGIPAGTAGRTRPLDSSRIIRQMVHGLAAEATCARFVNPAGLDQAELPDWLRSMATSLQVLNSLLKTMTKELEGSGW